MSALFLLLYQLHKKYSRKYQSHGQGGRYIVQQKYFGEKVRHGKRKNESIIVKYHRDKQPVV
jgi:hypothetical protein